MHSVELFQLISAEGLPKDTNVRNMYHAMIFMIILQMRKTEGLVFSNILILYLCASINFRKRPLLSYYMNVVLLFEVRGHV